MRIIENRLKQIEQLKEKGNFTPKIKIINYKEYDEPYIYDAETGEYFSCVDVMEDYYKDNNKIMPKYAYGVYFEPIKLDLYYILENACEEHHEDAISSLDSVGELEEAIEKFNEDNKLNGSYFEDTNTIVKLF